mgnify:CR=1 FL=1
MLRVLLKLSRDLCFRILKKGFKDLAKEYAQKITKEILEGMRNKDTANQTIQAPVPVPAQVPEASVPVPAQVPVAPIAVPVPAAPIPMVPEAPVQESMQATVSLIDVLSHGLAPVEWVTILVTAGAIILTAIMVARRCK